MNYAQTFLMANMNAFPSETLPVIKGELDQLDEESFTLLLMTDLKNPITALLFAIFLGEFGIDRFYTGNKELGIAKLVLMIVGCVTVFFVIGFFLLLGVYIWKLVDCFLIMGACKKANFERFMWRINQVKTIQQARAKSTSAATESDTESVAVEEMSTTSEPVPESVAVEEMLTTSESVSESVAVEEMSATSESVPESVEVGELDE